MKNILIATLASLTLTATPIFASCQDSYQWRKGEITQEFNECKNRAEAFQETIACSRDYQIDNAINQIDLMKCLMWGRDINLDVRRAHTFFFHA